MTMKPVAFPKYYVKLTSSDHADRFVGTNMAGCVPIPRTLYSSSDEPVSIYWGRDVAKVQTALKQAGYSSELVLVTGKPFPRQMSSQSGDGQNAE